MTMTDDHRTHDRPTAAPTASTQQTILDQVGGPWGMVYSTLPVLVLVVIWAFRRSTTRLVKHANDAA